MDPKETIRKVDHDQDLTAHDRGSQERAAHGKKIAEDQKVATEKAIEDAKNDPVKREQENRRIDQERMAAGKPTTVKAPDAFDKDGKLKAHPKDDEKSEIIVTDGATYDGNGNKIKR